MPRFSSGCNLDSDGCTGGIDPDTLEPGPCDECREWAEAEMRRSRREWAVASPEERDPEGYRRDMIDAGRGHLLGKDGRHG